ncbi:hypothetical protein Bca4012_080962 [Brassica carinata]
MKNEKCGLVKMWTQKCGWYKCGYELFYRRPRASCIGLDVVTGKVSSRSVYNGLKDEIFSELEPELDRGNVDGG